jgi:Zn-dependent protease with chaperone function
MTSTVLNMLLHATAAGILAYVTNAIALMPWRRSRDCHWTERARLLWPARVSRGQNVVVLPLLLGVAAAMLPPQDDGFWPLNALAGVCAVIGVSYYFDRETTPHLTAREWVRQTFAGYALRLSAWGIVALFGVFMPREWGWRMFAMMVSFLTLYLAAISGAVFPLLRAMGLFYEPTERMRRIAGETSDRMQVQVRGIMSIRSPYAVAYAWPTRGMIAFSERFMEICSDREVAAIAAHELAHLREPSLSIAGRIVGAMGLVPLVFIRPAVHALGGFVGLMLPMLTTWGLFKFSTWHSHRLEKKADATAAETELDAGDYARALEKIYRENQLPAVNPTSDSTHPHLYDRMVAAGLTPDYPLPNPPAKLTLAGQLYWAAVGAMVSIYVVEMVIRDG